MFIIHDRRINAFDVIPCLAVNILFTPFSFFEDCVLNSRKERNVSGFSNFLYCFRGKYFPFDNYLVGYYLRCACRS
jgi:hypothetical protein